MEIRIYSLGCPRCDYIIELIKKKKVPAIIISDEGQVLAEADKYNLYEIPFAIIDNKVYEVDELEKFVEELQ